MLTYEMAEAIFRCSYIIVKCDQFLWPSISDNLHTLDDLLTLYVLAKTSQSINRLFAPPILLAAS